MNKLTAILMLFRKGHVVADPAAWKARQITITALAGALLALVQVLEAFGYALPVSPDDAAALAGGILTVVNIVLTVTTTDKVGLPPVGDDPPEQPPKPDPRIARPATDEHYLG